MIDYCLLTCLINNEINSYNFYGDYNIHSKITQICELKNITKHDNPNLVLIYKESYNFIDFFCKNKISHETQWLFIVPQSLQEAILLFKELRSIGDAHLIQYPLPILIIKNFKENFLQYHRNDILQPVENYQTIDNFLNFNLYKTESYYDKDFGNFESQILKSLTTNNMFVYVGEEISEHNLMKCQQYGMMKFNIIECVDCVEQKHKGYFVHKDFVEKMWLYHLTKLQSLENLLKFKECYIILPV
jgi:hypothetical protein